MTVIAFSILRKEIIYRYSTQKSKIESECLSQEPLFVITTGNGVSLSPSSGILQEEQRGKETLHRAKRRINN